MKKVLFFMFAACLVYMVACGGKDGDEMPVDTATNNGNNEQPVDTTANGGNNGNETPVDTTANGGNNGDEPPVDPITTGEYVDLGLPSGTKWKTENEKNPNDAEHDFYTYEEAVAKFGNKLPTKEQFEELKDSCIWSWTGDGYKVYGPNGDSITLPAAGYRNCNGNVNREGTDGCYWSSSTPYDPDYAWYITFYSTYVYTDIGYRCYGQSVRLVR